MPIEQLALGASAALGDDIIRELLSAALSMARGDVRDITLELAADRRPILTAKRITKGAPIPKR